VTVCSQPSTVPFVFCIDSLGGLKVNSRGSFPVPRLGSFRFFRHYPAIPCSIRLASRPALDFLFMRHACGPPRFSSLLPKRASLLPFRHIPRLFLLCVCPLICFLYARYRNYILDLGLCPSTPPFFTSLFPPSGLRVGMLSIEIGELSCIRRMVVVEVFPDLFEV